MNPTTQELTILIATHKPFTPPNDKIYLPIQVGTSAHLPYYSEHQLDNIAAKNPHFCELTILYFIWKNMTTPMVGLVHYRRYFGIRQHGIIRKWYQLQYALGRKPKYMKNRYRIAKQADLMPILAQHDMIIPTPLQLNNTVYEHYDYNHIIRDWECVKRLIKQYYPEYLPTVQQVEQGNTLYMCNMFIGKKELINQYCQWLFTILFAAEPEIDFSNYSGYNKRVFGFLAERLFTVWIVHHWQQYSFFQLPIFNTET